MRALPSLTAMRLLSWVHPCLFSSPLFTWLSFMMDSKFQWYVYTFCKDWCWSWNSNTLATWWEELTHFKRPWCWERLRAGGEGDDRGWDGWWHYPLNGHGFGWTLGVGEWQGGLVCWGSWGRKELDTTERLNWTELCLLTKLLEDSKYFSLIFKILRSIAVAQLVVAQENVCSVLHCICHWRTSDVSTYSVCVCVCACVCVRVCVRMRTRACVLNHAWVFATSWTVARQAPLSIEFSRQEYWSWEPYPTPQ